MTDIVIRDVDEALEMRLREEAARGGGDYSDAAKRLLEGSLDLPPLTAEDVENMPLGQALMRAFEPIRADPVASREVLGLLEASRRDIDADDAGVDDAA